MKLSGRARSPGRCGVRRVPRGGGYPDAGALDKVTAGRRWQSAAGEVSRVRTSPVGRGRKLRPTPLRYV
jgi:hypothetical protein